MVSQKTLVGTASYFFSTVASYNGLAQTPQMGWDNWNTFGCSVSADLILSQAQLIVKLGLRDLGYQYVILDDCWSSGRDSSGALVADKSKFPGGMKAVADQVHALGLKYGMYSSAGTATCAGYAGSLGHEAIDAKTWASWGVDYLKYDNCNNQGQAGTEAKSFARYKAMSDALLATGRPIMYGLCNWGEDKVWNWGANISNSWRISGDVYDSYGKPDGGCPCATSDNCPRQGYHCSILNIINKAAPITAAARSGGWNDLDMLTVGQGGMSDAEYVTEFSLWSAVKSPLLSGASFNTISPASLAILANAAVIAVNQDPLGTSAVRRWERSPGEKDPYGRPASQQMWSGQLASTTGGGQQDAVVVLLNGLAGSSSISATLAEIFPNDTQAAGRAWEVRDLWGFRMTDDEAKDWVARGKGSPPSYTGTSYYYNATQTSYAAGLANKTELLLGKVVNTVQAGGSVTATVAGHGAAMFRLRAV